MAEQQPEPGTAARRGQDEVTSASLLERARAKDPDAWRRLVALYQPLVRYWIARARLPAQDGEDVGQEVFAAAAAGLQHFRRDRPGDTFRGWLHAITHNQVLLYHRRNQGRPQAEGGSGTWLQRVADPADGPEDGEAAEVSDLYRRALEHVRCEFEERTWRAFWRTVIDTRMPVDVAAELGMTPAAVRQAKSRVLRRLKQEMGELLE
jgi:RNA polymerase sigma-70 factor (ECF subfamily)